jgi:hypothetical protein
MKKLLLSTAIILGNLSIYASISNNFDNTKNVVNFQSEYTEVVTNAVPAAVKKALQTAYPSAKLDKAFVNEKKEYKLEISVGDQKTTVYLDSNGSWLKV